MRSSCLIGLIVAAACGAPRVSSGPAPTNVIARVGVKSLRQAIDSVADSPEFSNGYWGILVVASNGDTLYSRNAGKLFMPASNQKLLTSSVALTQLGADFRYRTMFIADGVVRDGVLDGNLGVIGRGDPTVSDHMLTDAMAPMRNVADSIAARGVKRIRGRILALGNAFAEPVFGFGWSWDDFESAYSAPTDELLFNEGFTNIVVRAGRAPGDSVTVATRPTRTWPRVRVHVTTVARPPAERDSTRPLPEILVRKDSLTGDVIVSGTIVAGDSSVEVVTHSDPDAAYVAALREALIDRGVTIADEVLAPGPRTDTLAVMISQPLSAILPIFLKPSQNQIGEMLFKTLGLERDTVPAMTPRQIVETQLRAWGARDEGFVVRDGSGLSRYDYVSPATIVDVLSAMRSSPYFPLFYQSLPIAGVDGTIRSRMRGTPAENNAHAKTGSVAQARSLSGYVTALNGDTLTFSVLANNWNVPARAVERAADSIAARIASFRRK